MLLESVVHALPVYCMSCFRLSKSVCSDITKLASKFWWSNGEKENKMHWTAWHKMTETKDNGGLGFKDLEAFNIALLGKQIWRLLTKTNLLMSRVMKCKYFPKSDVLNAPCKPWDSWVWKSWQGAAQMIKEGSGWWQVGNGVSIRVWEDDWLDMEHLRKPVSARPEGYNIKKVKDLFNQQAEGWDKGLLRSIFNENEVSAILRRLFSSLGLGDRRVWKYSPHGQYSVKSGYRWIKEKENSKMAILDLVPKLKKKQSYGGKCGVWK